MILKYIKDLENKVLFFINVFFLNRVYLMLTRHCLTYHIIFNKPKIFPRIVVAEELIR